MDPRVGASAEIQEAGEKSQLGTGKENRHGVARRTIRVKLPRGIRDGRARRAKVRQSAFANAGTTGNEGGLCATEDEQLDEGAGRNGGPAKRAGRGGAGPDDSHG
jgi:hypothetical protein